jgi:hypothetical protein
VAHYKATTHGLGHRKYLGFEQAMSEVNRLPHCYTKSAIILPRQTRDKHRESSTLKKAGLSQIEKLMKLRDAGANRSPELHELHLGFMPLRERVGQALRNLIAQRELAKIRAQTAEAATASRKQAKGKPTASNPQQQKQQKLQADAAAAAEERRRTDDEAQAYQRATEAVGTDGDKKPIARADVKAALDADPLLVRKTAHLFLSFPYICPEPVLVK